MAQSLDEAKALTYAPTDLKPFIKSLTKGKGKYNFQTFLAADNWKKTKRLIFKSTLFGDDNDRALQKDDGTWTYFANDVAYHSDKINRKFDHLINILGADHAGYIKRITSVVEALSLSLIHI